MSENVTEKTEKNVHIVGDKTVFVSKNAILRFKQDARRDNLGDASEYLKEEWNYSISQKDGDLIASLFREVKEDKKDKKGKGEKEQRLSSKIRALSEKRQSEKSISDSISKKLEQMNVPSSIIDSYAHLKKLGNPIVSPVDIAANKEEYQKMISGMLPNMPPSPYTDYYKDILKWLTQ